MYATIDAIQEGDAPWTTIEFKYSAPLPRRNPPKWMTQTYELCTRDTRLVLQQQLANPDFADQINYVPYKQFNAEGDRSWSNLMSAEWAWRQAVSLPYSTSLALEAYTNGQDMIYRDDPTTAGCMFVPVVKGSDKTTTSVGTGHQEFHPEYMGPGNLTNIARRARGNAILPVAFLPIPKGEFSH
jgi:hypothetical protein